MKNPRRKYSDADARLVRALRHVSGASSKQISVWTGIPTTTVQWLQKRNGVSADNDETRRALLIWWLEQRLPQVPVAQPDPVGEERHNIIQQFKELLDRADELNERSKQ